MTMRNLLTKDGHPSRTKNAAAALIYFAWYVILHNTTRNYQLMKNIPCLAYSDICVDHHDSFGSYCDRSNQE